MLCDCDMETYDPYVERRHRARIEHRCSDCGGRITAGERYLLHGGRFDGSWSMAKRCADCDFLIAEVGRAFMAECGGWSCVFVGDLPQSWEDVCEHLDADQYAEARRIVGMQRAVCKARDGNRLWSLWSWMEADDDDEDEDDAPV